jgi:hypothetical protein
MTDTIIVPPRISNTPPPIDSSFDETSSNSKSTDDFNQLNLDDSDIVDKEQNISFDIDVVKDRSETLTNDSCDKTFEAVNNVLKASNDDTEENNEESGEWAALDTMKDEEDSFNLSDDKLKIIIENFNISSDVPIDKNFVDSDWDPFGGNTESTEENAGDWAAFDDFSNEKSAINEENLDKNSDLFNDFKSEVTEEPESQQKLDIDEGITNECDDNVVQEGNFDNNDDDDDDWDNFVSVENHVEVQTDQLLSSVGINDKDEAYYEHFMRNVDRMFEKALEKETIFEANDGFQVDEDYLFKTKDVTDEWNKLLDFKNSDCLKFVWRGSKIEEFYLNSINIDRKNVNIYLAFLFRPLREVLNSGILSVQGLVAKRRVVKG